MNASLHPVKGTMAGNQAADRSMQHYVAVWRKRIKLEQERAAHLATRAKEDARKIAVMLHDQYGATQVILFGSLVSGRFAEGSDIDLAAEGISKAEFFQAMAEANAMAGAWVDLKPLEDLNPHFLQRVQETGEDLL